MSKNTNKKKNHTKLSDFGNNNIYIFLSFVCSAVIMLLVYYTNQVIPFGEKTVLRMDLFHQYGPLFGELYDRIIGTKSFLYSWNTGGGSSFIGNYYNYLSSPIGIVITVLFGHKNIPEAIGTMVLVKNGLSASIFAYYLKKKFNKNDFSISAFGILYAFCGFFIAYYWNVMWIDALYLLPLIIYGIERIIDKKKPLLYIISLSISFISSYYMSYMICIFSIFYFLVYYISNYGFNESFSTATVNSKKLKILNNRFLISGFTFAFSSFLAVGLVAFALIPTFFCLKECSATSGSFPESIKYYNDIFDFLSNHLADLDPTIRSSGDTVLPNVYCGIINLILIPLFIFNNKIKGKKKAAYTILLSLFFVCFNLNFANYIIHAFHFPNDLPFRFSFIYSFFILSMSFEALTYIKDTSVKSIIGSGFGVLIFIILCQKFKTDNICDDTIYLSIGFTALYTLILSLLRKKEYAASAVSLLLMCSIFAEACVSDIQNFNITQQKPNFVREYDSFKEAKTYLDKKENNSFYRMELFRLGNGMIMMPSWYNYNGISVFSSMAYEKSANLQKQLGLDSNYINSYIYNSQTPIYNGLMSLKYLVSYNDDAPEINDNLFKNIATFGNFSIYENKYCLPLAFSVDKKIKDWKISGNDPFEIQNEFVFYSTGVRKVLKQLNCKDYVCENVTDNTDYTQESFTCFKDNTDTDGKLTLNYEIQEEENVYVYFDSSDVENIDYAVNGESLGSQDTDDPYVYDCGKLLQSDVLSIEVPLDTDIDSFSADCYVYSVDINKLNQVYSILNKNGLKISDYSESKIIGSINCSENDIIFTSVNYDDGWKVYIDGKEVETFKTGDALLAFSCTPGNHYLEMRYIPKGLFIGLIISLSSLLLLVIIIISKSVWKRLKNKSNEEITQSNNEENVSEPKGIDVLIKEKQTEFDSYSDIIENNRENIARADEILNTQRLNIKEILNGIETDERDNGDENGQNNNNGIG